MRSLLLLLFLVSLFVPGNFGEAATYYASPNGQGNGSLPAKPFLIASFWEKARPGDTLILLDGIYQNTKSMITPPKDLSGTKQAPITVQAMHDGKVTIDGEGTRRPIALYHNDWWILEGINAHNSKSTVVNISRSNHCIVRRVCGWDAADGNTNIFAAHYGWAGGVVPTRNDVFSIPFLANVTVGSTSENNPRGFNICTRIRSLDAIPFNNRLVFDMEASPGTQIRNPWNLLGYSAVTFWYAMPGATSNRPALPEKASKPIVSLELLDQKSAEIRHENIKQIEGAIEFENLKPSAKSLKLRCGPQRPAAAFDPDKTWSGGEHFFIAGQKAGDFVEFTFTEQFQPVNMKLYLTKSYDFGIIRLFVNGKKTGDDIDLYSRKSVVGEPVELGLIMPVNNRIVLRMELVGKNNNARGNGSYMGLDCIVLEASIEPQERRYEKF